MTTPLQGFFWLLADDDQSPGPPAERSPGSDDAPPALRLVGGFDRSEPTNLSADDEGLLNRLQDDLGSDVSDREHDDAAEWRSLAGLVILAIGMTIIAALGAGVLFSGL